MRIQKDGLDRFYTRHEVARVLVSQIRSRYPDAQYVEPSAGDGAFSNLLPGVLAYDIEPKHDSIVRQDFFDLSVPRDCVFVGNPPFGKQASLAVRFFNRCASLHAKSICFVLPRSFRKHSVQKRLHKNYHLIHDEIMEHDSFVLDGESYDVPTVFQIWERRGTERVAPETPTPNESYAFCKKVDSNESCFSIRRVGVNAGRAFADANGSESSHYFIRLADPTHKSRIVNELNTRRWISADNTVGPRSLAKSELIPVLNDLI